MDRSLKIKTTVLGAAGLFNLQQQAKQSEARNLVVHTMEVITQLHYIRASVKDAELAEEGYALTGKEHYLQQLSDSEPKAHALVDTLRTLTKDNPDQQRQLGALCVKIDEKFAYLKETIAMLKSSKHDQALTMIKADGGRKILDDIRSIIAEMMAREEGLLRQRSDVLQEEVRLSRAALLSLIVLAVLLFLFMARLIIRFLAARQMAVAELERNEKELSDFFENAVVPLQWVGSDGRILRVNKAECSMLGYSAEELLGRHIEEIHVDKSTIEDVLTRLKAQEELKNYEARLRCKDGSIKTVLIDSNVHFENGVFIHSRCFARDITLQKKAESELLEKEARTRTLVETAPDAILTFDGEGIIESTNKAGAAIFGWPASEMVGSNISRFIPGFFADREKLSELNAVSTGQNQIFEVGKETVGINKEGVTVPIEMAWSILNLGNRSVLTAIIRDISSRKTVEKRLALQYEIGKILSEARTIEVMTKRILELIGEKMQWSIGGVWLIDKSEHVLKCADLWSLSRLSQSKFVARTMELKFAPGIGLPGRVWSSGQPCCITNVSEDVNFLRADQAKDEGIRAAMAFPIIAGEEVIGVFDFFAEDDRGIDSETQKTMAAVGHQIGQFIVRMEAEAALRQSEERFRLLLSNVRDYSIILLDQEGHVKSWNEGAQRIHGYIADEIIGKLVSIFYVAKDVDSGKMEKDLQMAREEGRFEEEDWRLRRDGSQFFANVVITPLKDENGQLRGFAKITRDITERRSTEQALAASQERYNLAVQGSHDGIWDWDLANDKVFYSDIAYQQLGYEQDEIDVSNRQALSSLVHPDDLPLVLEAIKGHLELKKPYDIEYRLRTKSGDYKWIHSRGQAVWDDSGKPTRFTGSHRDITQRIQDQERIKLSESRFRQMAETIKEIFWITDARGSTPVYVSPAYEQIFGRTIESLFQNPSQFFEATHVEDREKLAKTIRKQREVDYSCEIEYRITRPSGEVRWLWARLCSIVDGSGKIIGLSGVTNDITDRKEAEVRVSEFYSTVSHELRTPLTSIRGSLGLIEGGLTGAVTPATMQMIKIGRTEADRLIRLINDILDIKKVEAGQLELHKSLIEPEKLVTTTLEAIAGMASEANVKLKSAVSTRYLINGDRERLMQVLTNLVSNAIKFSAEGSTVTVTVETRPNNMLRFCVNDNGPGIPTDQMHKLFGKFKQLDSSDSRRKGGTGLGLAISKSIVEQHDGQIGVESEEGKGSQFWFDLPFDPRSASGEGGSRVKALVIEPEEYWSEILQGLFSEGTFDTRIVKTTSAAETLLTSYTPDLIVLDLQSTDGQGFEFLERLKGNGETNKIPVIILSGEERDSGPEGQAILFDWIKKPFEPRQIKKAVAKAIRQRQPGPVTILIVEDDSATREVLRQQIVGLGVNCLEAADGLQAVDIARKQNLDLMILDLGLPLLDGFEVIKVLREDKSKQIPLIVYTNRDLTKQDKKNLSLGLTSHLVKARTTGDELLACVKDLLSGLLEPETSDKKH
jgi:PAS domain S-box-containing protein